MIEFILQLLGVINECLHCSFNDIWLLHGLMTPCIATGFNRFLDRSPVSGDAHYKKLYRLFSLYGTRVLPYIGCRVSDAILALSLELATNLRL